MPKAERDLDLLSRDVAQRILRKTLVMRDDLLEMSNDSPMPRLHSDFA
jgi:hypothetical protein